MSGIIIPSSSNAFRARRLSNADASHDSISKGPTVVVPPKRLMAGSEMSELAAAMDKARHELQSESGNTTPTSPIETTVTDKYAFAFDIDGVLIRGGRPIPEAIEAMKMLNGENEYGVKVLVRPSLLLFSGLIKDRPYIFVTNGGGKSESERCQQLSQQLEIDVAPGQFICGHTPMREMAEKYNTVLVVGGEGMMSPSSYCLLCLTLC